MSGPGPMVAVIDDDAGVCESTRFLLETYDSEVQTYLSGADFLRYNPDIACLMPIIGCRVLMVHQQWEVKS